VCLFGSFSLISSDQFGRGSDRFPSLLKISLLYGQKASRERVSAASRSESGSINIARVRVVLLLVAVRDSGSADLNGIQLDTVPPRPEVTTEH